MTACAAHSAVGRSSSEAQKPPSLMSAASGGPSPYGPSPQLPFVCEFPVRDGWAGPSSNVLSEITHVVDGTRSLFRGDFGDGDVLVGAGIAIELRALLAWWGTRVFQRQSA